MIHFMHQNSNEPANIEPDYAMQTHIPTFCPPTYSFNFIWLFCFFFVEYVSLYFARILAGAKLFLFFEFAFITMQWICKKERSPLVRSVCFMYIHVERYSTDFSFFYDKSHTEQIIQWFRSHKIGCSKFQKNTYASYVSCCNTSYEDNLYIFMVTAMTMIHLISHMNLIHQVISPWFIWSSKWEPENICNNLTEEATICERLIETEHVNNNTDESHLVNFIIDFDYHETACDKCAFF